MAKHSGFSKAPSPSGTQSEQFQMLSAMLDIVGIVFGVLGILLVLTLLISLVYWVYNDAVVPFLQWFQLIG